MAKRIWSIWVAFCIVFVSAGFTSDDQTGTKYYSKDNTCLITVPDSWRQMELQPTEGSEMILYDAHHALGVYSYPVQAGGSGNMGLLTPDHPLIQMIHSAFLKVLDMEDSAAGDLEQISHAMGRAFQCSFTGIFADVAGGGTITYVVSTDRIYIIIAVCMLPGTEQDEDAMRKIPLSLREAD